MSTWPTAKRLGLAIVRVPAYSPHAVAEHAVALILALNRRLHRAYNRTREGDFSLHGLTGFDLVGKTVGVVGTGQIGATFAKIMNGFGCQLLAYDPFPNPAGRSPRRPLPELAAVAGRIADHQPALPAQRAEQALDQPPDPWRTCSRARC